MLVCAESFAGTHLLAQKRMAKLSLLCCLSLTAMSGVLHLAIISLHLSMTIETWLGSLCSTSSQTDIRSGFSIANQIKFDL